VHNVKINL